MADVMEYNKRIDGKVGRKQEFYKDPSGYESNFMPYAKRKLITLLQATFMEMEHRFYSLEKMLKRKALE